MDSLKEPAFYVDDIDMNDIDFEKPPTSGEDYIKRVIIEARRCADVVVADIKPEFFKTPTIDIEPLAGCVKAPAIFNPGLEWQHSLVVSFYDLRLYISQIKSVARASKQKLNPEQMQLPAIDDRHGWIVYCYEKRSENDYRTKTLLNMNQPLMEQVLEYLVEHLQTQEVLEHELGLWIFGLLSFLELPLNPDTCFCLRTLARTCSVIRANSKKLEGHEVDSLNLFICLVARYFRQMDLADQ